MTQINKFCYSKAIHGLTCKKGEPCDGMPFVLGMLTILKQFHEDIMLRFIHLSSQFIETQIEANQMMFV